MQSQLSVSNFVKFQKPPKIHKKADIIAPPRATQSIQVGARNRLMRLRVLFRTVKPGNQAGSLRQATNLEHLRHLGSQRPYPNRRTVIGPSDFLSLKVSFRSFFLFFFSNVQNRAKKCLSKQTKQDQINSHMTKMSKGDILI